MSSCILLIFHISILFHPAFLDSYRLHDFVVPKHYNLKILTSVEDDIIYTGTLEIVTKCLNTTKKITLHRDRSIKLDKIELKEIDTPQNYKTIREVPMEQILYSNKLDILTMSTQKNLTENKYYLIYVEFKGNLSGTPTGIFRGNFSSSSGTSFYAITFFEPMGARRAFPCFDEPGMTATFGLSIGRKEKFNSTSNMQLSKTEPVENKTGWFWDHFMNSIPMSTYSVSFMIYDAGFTRIGEKEDQIKILARKDMVPSLEMVTRTAPKMMAYFQKYFQVPFPLSKVDLIALPAVATEVSISSPGLVVIQEKSLFYESFTMKQDEVQDILFHLSQKIAYQWISVVSVKWWSDLWTKVSLANLNARDALANLSESQSIERDVPDALLQFFHKEGGLPFTEDVYGDIDSVTTALSYIDYEKCGLLMRMARRLTEDTAVKDLTTSFLKKKSFQKVNQEEFWKIFEYSSKSLYNAEAPLNDVIRSWSNQSGIPVIRVIRNYKSETAMILQKVNVNEQMASRWIPISYASKGEGKAMNKNVRLWLKSPNDTVTIGPLPSSDWLLLNLDVYFPYRINYDVGNWNLLHSALKDPSLYETIPPLNRMQLVDDLFEFTLGNSLNITFDFFLDFMEFLRFDQSYSTWTAFSKNMYRLHWRLHPNEEAVNLLGSYMQNLLRRHFRARKFCMKENSLLNVSFSTVITEAACFFKLPVCLREVKDYYTKYRMSKNPFNEDSPFSTDLRGVIFCYAIKHGGVEDFNFLLKAYISSKNIFERRDMLQGLYCTQDTSLLKGIPIGKRVSRSVQVVEDQVSKTIKIRETAENLDDSKSTDSLSTTTEIKSPSYQNAPKEDINSNSPSIASLGSSSSTEISTNSSSTTLSTNSSSTVGTNGTITTSIPGNLGNISDNPLSPEQPSSSNASKAMGNTGQMKLDLNSQDLENIILRSKIDVASDLFYQKIITISLTEALRHIWLFTERINERKYLDNFKKFFNQNRLFVGIEQQIKNRIKHVEYNLKWQENKTEEMVKALKKHLGVKEQLKSDAFTYSVTGKLFIILGSLSISFFHVYLIK